MLFQFPLIAQWTLTKSGSPYHFNSSLTIPKNITLKIEPGVHLIFSDSIDITVLGNVQMLGTQQNPILIGRMDSISPWGHLIFRPSSKKSILHHVTLFEGGINAEGTNLELKNCTVVNSYKSLSALESMLQIRHGEILIDNCQFWGNYSGEGVQVEYADIVLIKNSGFHFIADAIELIGITNSVIENNLIELGGDDGIDLNFCRNILIIGNTIMDFPDSGLEIGGDVGGPSYTINIEKNVIGNCNTGVTIKDGSSAQIYNNTFYQNATGVSSVTDKAPNSDAIIWNCIFYNSIVKDVRVEPENSLQLVYSLSNQWQHNYTGCILADPQFADEITFDFHLQNTSPCINAGDPLSDPDPDGSTADMGAFHTGRDAPLNKSFLRNNFPQPFYYSTTFQFYLAENSSVVMHIYNPYGQLLRSLEYGTLSAGNNRIFWDQTNDPTGILLPGIYYLQLCLGGNCLSGIQKLMVAH